MGRQEFHNYFQTQSPLTISCPCVRSHHSWILKGMKTRLVKLRVCCAHLYFEWMANKPDQTAKDIQIPLQTSCWWKLLLYSNQSSASWFWPREIISSAFSRITCFKEIQVASIQNWERAGNRRSINKHTEKSQGCQRPKWKSSVWAEGLLINSSALRGRDGLHSIKPKAVGPLLSITHTHNTLATRSVTQDSILYTILSSRRIKYHETEITDS